MEDDGDTAVLNDAERELELLYHIPYLRPHQYRSAGTLAHRPPLVQEGSARLAQKFRSFLSSPMPGQVNH